MFQTTPDIVRRSARFCARERAQGKKLLRMWVIDPTLPEIREEVARQVVLLRDAPEEREAVDFLEAVWAEDGWPE